jgi:hypothetical protein
MEGDEMEGLFTPENRQSWQELFNSLDVDRPSVGRMVRVTGGKKHLGKEGKVFWHGKDKYSDAYRYGSPAQWHFRDAAGRYGWRVGVDTGAEKFFISADKVEIVKEA